MRKSVSKKCLLVRQSYTDFEIGERVTLENYCKDLDDVIKYLEDMKQEWYMVSAKEYRCREDLELKIKDVYIPQKKYVSLFE